MGRVLYALLLAVALAAFAVCPAYAADMLGAEAIDQPATLVGAKAKAPIPLSLRPAPNQPNTGYGISGDPVTVTEQLASFLPEADPATTWNHIRLDNEPYTEGWVQGRFLSFEDESSP